MLPVSPPPPTVAVARGGGGRWAPNRPRFAVDQANASPARLGQWSQAVARTARGRQATTACVDAGSGACAGLCAASLRHRHVSLAAGLRGQGFWFVSFEKTGRCHAVAGGSTACTGPTGSTVHSDAGGLSGAAAGRFSEQGRKGPNGWGEHAATQHVPLHQRALMCHFPGQSWRRHTAPRGDPLRVYCPMSRLPPPEALAAHHGPPSAPPPVAGPFLVLSRQEASQRAPRTKPHAPPVSL